MKPTTTTNRATSTGSYLRVISFSSGLTYRVCALHFIRYGFEDAPQTARAPKGTLCDFCHAGRVWSRPARMTALRFTFPHYAATGARLRYAVRVLPVIVRRGAR